MRVYVWLEGLPIAVIENRVVYFVRADHIGRPVFATDAAGAKVWEATYLPFGGVHTTGGTPIQLRFPGQWYQAESGLHQNWMRDYDPTTGRYMQADPLGLVPGPSVYGYAYQNPGKYTDPDGLDPIPTSPPSNIPGGPWTPNPNGRPGEFLGPKDAPGGRPTCQWVPESKNTPRPYWKTKPHGGGWNQRYDMNGNPISPEEAHPGNPPDPEDCECNEFPRLWRLPFPLLLFFGDPDDYMYRMDGVPRMRA